MNNDNNNNNRNKIRRRKVSSSNTQTTSSNSKTSTSTSRNNKGKKKTSNSKDKFKFLRVTGILLLVLLVIGVAGGAGVVFATLKDVQPVNKAVLDNRTDAPSSIYYDDESFLGYAPSLIKKDPITYDEMPEHIINAIIAIEDERFYEHSGIDWRGFARSVLYTLKGSTQGGSTIAMQTSKMLLTTYDQTITRKIKDMYYAYEMTNVLSHEDILEAYLNNFSVGRNLSGVQAGAQGYFSKDASELTLAECALLAGSTKYPAKFAAFNTAKLDGTETKEDLEHRLLFYINTDSWDDPTQVELDMIDKLLSWGLISKDTHSQLKSGEMIVRKAVNNPDAKERQEVVLYKMLELEYITRAEYEEALAEEIVIKLPEVEDVFASSVEDYIEDQVIDALIAQGNTEEDAKNMLSNGGLQIYTTIDSDIQSILEDEYNKDSNFPNNVVGSNGVIQPQSSTVIIDHSTGQIKGLIGGRQITVKKGQNRATTPQQPGSTIKPLSVYAPIIDSGLDQSLAISDSTSGYKFSINEEWSPATTTSGSGSMSLRKSLAYSSNTIAVKLAEMLGNTYEESVEVMLDYLMNFGITTLEPEDRYFPALTLGGMSKGISPLEMAAAYATLANGGVYIEPTVFTKVTTSDGQILVNNTPSEHKVLDPEVAYVVTDMLQAVVNEGIGGSASLSRGMPSAGKTGTTNGALGIWFVGYTPYYTGATFIGDDAGVVNPETGQIVDRRSMSSSSYAAKLWATIMNKIHSNLSVKQFEVPSNIYFATINLNDGGRDSNGVSAAFITGTGPSRPTTQPPEPEEEEEEEEEVEEEEEEEVEEDGPDEDGPDEGAPDEGAPDEDGPDEDGPDEGAPDEGGPDEENESND